MSIDFGGPINKAAYVFGTASLMDASGAAVSSGIMASVMIGGMVPPIAISLSMMVFKRSLRLRNGSRPLRISSWACLSLQKGLFPLPHRIRFTSFRRVPLARL